MARLSLYTVETSPSEARKFDKWFYSLPKKEQDSLRDSGVYPYGEMAPIKNVFAVDEDHQDWAVNDKDATRTETDEFIRKEYVEAMLKAFMDAIAYSDSFNFRRHVELVRWALSMPGCLSSRSIAKMYGKSHEYVRKKAQKIRAFVDKDGVGHFPHVNSKRDKNRREPRIAA